MTSRTISINRAPVLTLWAAIVAERLGFTADEALSLAKALAGLNAQSKGRKLGIFKPQEQKPEKARQTEPGEVLLIEILGRSVPAINTDEGIRALHGSKPINPQSARRYLEHKFGEDLPAVRTAMTSLARAYKPKELAQNAYSLYERFRPSIPEGVKGWGARGDLDLGRIQRLAKERG